MPITTTPSAHIWYDVLGPDTAPALLLSNALGTTHALWDGQIPAWAADFRVIRYDTRGHGHSATTPGHYSLDQLGHDAVAVLDACGIPRAHVCGISLGGLTAMWLALEAPHRVDRLVLANTAARIGTPESWDARIAQVRRDGLISLVEQTRSRWFTSRFAAQHPEAVREVVQTLAECDPDGYVGCCAALRDADLRSALPRIGAPTLVITGAHDPSTPSSDGAALCRAIGGSQLVELDTAHLSNVEHAARFTEIVTKFLKGDAHDG